MALKLVTDGSSTQDRDPPVTIDRSIPAHRWRYTCPKGCSDWVPTNGHIYCRPCARAAEHGHDVDPRYWEIRDQRTGELIDWSRVEIAP